MVSFWPFKGDDSSAASFEKVLSQLSTKINRASAQNDTFRQKQRRYKVLWTLYTTFAYILVATILTLVTGYQRWGAVEYTAIVGSPVLIFAIRTALDAYYNYRVANTQSYLNDLHKQRDQAIQKLKAATKYDSTQQLLDKYGGTPRKTASSPQPAKKRKSDGPQLAQGSRTGFAPPPTANIQRPSTSGGPAPSAQSASTRNFTAPVPSAPGPPQQPPSVNEEFAPNAFSLSPPIPPALNRQASAQYSEGHKWYDRILDVVLGEDETQAKNRLALICHSCRLVNGQAPPGARTAEDIGRWRCSSCQAWNGTASEHGQILSQISGASEPDSPKSPRHLTAGEPMGRQRERDGDLEHASRSIEDEDEDEDDEDDAVDLAAETTTASGMESSPADSTRSKARQRRKA
ncbi:hypothetical protein LTR62_004010 [Meristemomyces frigidus]|uniref:Endoplasmic reticulum junction formation protein lunapark n=1 Tax=Meristemomyces frigidus TaxID=1508187 RepID=A0AAN7YJI2_9PEZI|nr:hypothetical protein LTR62_004010 [Meristemomyces frigidus]